MMFLLAAVAAMAEPGAGQQMRGEEGLQVLGGQLIRCVRDHALQSDDGRSATLVISAAFEACRNDRAELRRLAFLIRSVEYGDTDSDATRWADEYQDHFDGLLREDATRILQESRAGTHAQD